MKIINYFSAAFILNLLLNLTAKAQTPVIVKLNSVNSTREAIIAQLVLSGVVNLVEATRVNSETLRYSIGKLDCVATSNSATSYSKCANNTNQIFEGESALTIITLLRDQGVGNGAVVAGGANAHVVAEKITCTAGGFAGSEIACEIFALK